MEREKTIEEISFYLERIGERELETLRKVARNLHRSQRPGSECISALVTPKSTQWYRDGIAELAGKLQDHKHLVTVYNCICRYYAQEPGA